MREAAAGSGSSSPRPANGVLRRPDGSARQLKVPPPHLSDLLDQFDTLVHDGNVTFTEFEHYYKVRSSIFLRTGLHKGALAGVTWWCSSSRPSDDETTINPQTCWG